MPSPEGNGPPRVRIGLALLVLLGLSVVVAWQAPIPAKIPTVAWSSAWVFRAETFLGFFVGVYVLVAIVATTIRTGRPPRKLSFGMVSYEEAEVEKTADALNEGKVALQAVQQEVGELRRRLERTASSAREAHEGLLALTADDPHNRGVSERARQQLALLSPETERVPGVESEYERAMRRFEQTLGELDEMLARPRRVRRAG